MEQICHSNDNNDILNNSADSLPEQAQPEETAPAAGYAVFADVSLENAEHESDDMLPAPEANGDIRMVWKLKGTGKSRRRQVIESCAEGQPVFIICDANGENCTVITEEGEEIGRLNEKNTQQYHKFVERNPSHIYIKRIRLDQEKPRVKILLLVHDKPHFFDVRPLRCSR